MNKRNRKRMFQRIGFEQLEARELMAGQVMAATALLAHHQAPSAALGLAVAGRSSGASQSGPLTVLTAQFSDATTRMTAEVVYRSCLVNGTANTSLIVRADGAAADSTFDVSLDNTVVGQITVDANGEGQLSLFSNPKSPQQSPLPAGFPTSVAAGAVVSVGNATGSLATPALIPRGDHDGDGCHPSATVTRLTAPLTDSANSATAAASYKSVVENGVMHSRLKVSVMGATASSTLDVIVDGTVVGQLTTDAGGAGTLKLSSRTSTIPAITAGSSISVGATLTGSFAVATPSATAIAARWRHR